ncbi:metal-dependent hydrolase [Desulfuromonas versatilis]|uniref:Metal-dependent hydrolase n=1 Tax=Desulfuromonas versatilis TaxID=2802975 RepID=A0ABM8HX12_9BACT|nr:amidohydrolase family protein [Desulfuromonas versatilis]BCR05324.1 metal-dependent hydrolase [Desulfuromonas versatilis]
MTLYLARFLAPISAPPIEDGALLVRDGRIVAVGTRKEMLAAHGGAEVVDFGDAVLLPPMVNAHTHLELTHFPRWLNEVGEAAEVRSFVDWILRVIRVKRGVEITRFIPSLAEGIRLSLAAGTGAVGDILSYFPARQAYRRSPMAGNLYLETLGRDPLIGRKVLRGIGEILGEVKAGEMLLGISPHSPYSVSADYLEEVLQFGRRRKVPLSVHFAESPDEVDFLQDSAGPVAETLFPYVGWGDMVPPPAHRTPARYIAERGALAAPMLLVHGVQVEPRDMPLLAGSGVTVVLCPRSNANLGVGRAPAAAYRQAGVPLALGTDSLASCDSLSLWDEIAFAADWLQGDLGPHQLLRLATLDGARALRLDHRMGALAEGMEASFQVLRPAAVPRLDDLEAHLCAEGRRGQVEALYLKGREVLQKS